MSNEPMKEGWSDTKENPPDGLDVTATVARANARMKASIAAMDHAALIKQQQLDAPRESSGYLNVVAPPEPRFLDIPVGEGDDRRLASIPFGISVSDLEMIEDMLKLWRNRLTLKL